MGRLKKLFGRGDDDPAAARDADAKAFLESGPGSDTDRPAVTDADVAAAFGADVAGHEVALADDVVTNIVFALEGSDHPTVSVFVCNHTGLPGMADDDESCWRDLGVAREIPRLGDSAFVNEEGTLFARLGDRYTIQILSGKLSPDDANVLCSVALARTILRRLDGR